MRATFFVIGQHAATNPEMHESWPTAMCSEITAGRTGFRACQPVGRSELVGEIERTDRAISMPLDSSPVCFVRRVGLSRVRKPSLVPLASMILWSVDTRDWAPSKDRMKFATIIRKRAAVGLTEEHPSDLAS